ncbi:pyridoxal phosphate-dependent aminotransferase [Myxococcota bacterium]|nr:pyridoxal phosphate-dependent aminotransferase [Myxococcota bacterium]
MKSSSPSAGEVSPFLAMEIMERALEMEQAGAEVVHLEVGEPGASPPRAAMRACADALEAGETRYTDSRGLLELRQEIAADARRRFGARIDPERVIVTSGTSPAMLLVFSLLIEPGDEIVLGTPHYPCYPNFVRICGGTPIFVPMDPTRGYPLEVDEVRAAVNERTRAIVVGSPANPTGAVQSAETLRRLAEIGPPLISDEVYHGLVYDGVRATSAHEVCDDAFVFDGFSKRYAMTGFRLGWVVAPDYAVRRLRNLQQNLFISANRFVQHAGVAALREGAAEAEAARQVYDSRRTRLVAGLRELGFDVPQLPTGAFYVFADARRFGRDSLALASTLLERAQVAVAPGIDFGKAGEGWLRFCYAVSDDAIDTGLERLGALLPELEAAG